MNRATIRKLYRDAIVNVFGCDNKELDAQLLKAVKTDVHLGNKSPGQWSPDSTLEIYCENGIPNASDINDFSCYAAETGCKPSDLVSYNADRWDTIDGLVNLMLEAMGKTERYYHEPYNGAVVGIWSV
jgi:hypothetical protein